jgi:uncharacterized protein YggE
MNNLALLAVLVFSSTGLLAQFPARPPSVRASGEASVFALPDQVRIAASVTTQAKTAQDAASQNASQLAAVTSALGQLLGPNADIKTINYFVGPNYQYPPNGGTPILIGYTASNSIEVTLGTISMAGAVIDTAAQAGATTVGGLRFTLKNPEPQRLQALQLATLQARSHADAMVNALGGKVGPVITVQEGVQVRLQPLVGVADARSTPTSIQPGMIEVQASVVLEAQLN